MSLRSRPRLRRALWPHSTAVRLDQRPAPVRRPAQHIVRPTAHPLAGRSLPASLPTADGSDAPPAPQLLPSQQSRHGRRQLPQERDTRWQPKDKPPLDHPSAMRRPRQPGRQRRTRRKARCLQLPPHQRRLRRLPHHHRQSPGYWPMPGAHPSIALDHRSDRLVRSAETLCAQG